MFIKLTQTYKHWSQSVWVQSLNITKIYDVDNAGSIVHLIGDADGTHVDQKPDEIVAMTLKGKSL